VKSAAAADVPPPLREQRHAILTVQAMLASEAAAGAAPSDRAQQATDPVAEVFVAEIAAEAMRQSGPSADGIPAACSGSKPKAAAAPSLQSFSTQPAAAAAATATAFWWQPPQQLGQRQHIDASSALLRFADFDPGY
jgi:hypothetical protein